MSESTSSMLDHNTLSFIHQVIGTSEFSVEPIAGDASNRRYFRAIYSEDSCVVMLWDPFVDDGNYPFLSVHTLFAAKKILVPRVLAKNPKLGVILLEDLGDLTLERKFWENQNQELTVPFYKQAIDELIKIHYLASSDRAKSCTAFKVKFDVEKLMWEMNYGREHLLEKLCGIKLSAPLKSEIEAIFMDICTKLDAEPKYICHRDYHSRNIMLKLGKTRIIDFQDARMGPIQYDLVSLVHDAYVDLNETSRQEILDYYLARAKEHLGRPIELDDFYEVFRIQMLQRCFKACGSFASFFNTREDKRYLRYIKPTLKKVSETLDQYPQYAAFLGVLRDNGLLEKDFTKPVTTS